MQTNQKTKLSSPLSLIFLFYLLIAVPQQSMSFTYKLVIESKSELNELVVDNKSSGEVKKYKPWRDDKRSFLITTDDLSKNFIVAHQEMSIKLYRLDTQTMTNWIDVPRGTTLSLEAGFSKSKTQTCDINKFIISNYLSQPLVNETITLRSDCDGFIFDKYPQSAISTTDSIVYKWNEKYTVVSISFNQIEDSKSFWQSSNYASNSFSFNQLESQFSHEIVEGNSYELVVHYLDKSSGSSRINCCKHRFLYSPVIFNEASPCKFITADSVAISWQPNFSVTKAIILDVQNNRQVFEFQPASNSFNYGAYKNEFELEAYHNYNLCLMLTDAQNQIKEAVFNFYVSLSPNDYQKLKVFLEE